ncbi:MAG: FAD-dependent oxidoreductase [Pseudomonadales bacterium]
MRAPYPSYERPCGWQALLPAAPPRPRLAGSERADLVVVGAGFTGLAAARTWAEQRPADRVLVLDAAAVGDGSPGRNSGFMLEITLADDADPAAVSRLARCNELIGDTMTWLRELVQDHGIDCQLARSGTYRGAATTVGERNLARYRAFLEAAGLPFESLDRDALAARIGTRFYRAGLYSPDCSLVQPAALIRGLAAALPASVEILEHSPVVELSPPGRPAGGWRVRGQQGVVETPRVILANNGFARGLGVGASRLAVIYTYAGLTGPLEPGELESLGSDPGWGLLPAHRLGTTLRRTADGRLLARSLYGYERESDNAHVAVQLAASLRRRFPQLDRLAGPQPFAEVWGGTTGLTYNGAPLWGEPRPGLYVSAGCNGGGVVKGSLFGRLLARRALGEAVPDVGALFGAASWMPPEPLRRLGFVLQSSWERLSARAEA